VKARESICHRVYQNSSVKSARQAETSKQINCKSRASRVFFSPSLLIVLEEMSPWKTGNADFEKEARVGCGCLRCEVL